MSNWSHNNTTTFVFFPLSFLWFSRGYMTEMSQIGLPPLCQSSLDLWKLELIHGVRVYQARSTETSPARSSTREPLPPQLPAPFPPTCYTPVRIPA